MEQTDNEIHWMDLVTGASGSIELEQAWLRKAKEVFELFCEKQQGYGPNNIAVGGEQGVTLRLGDKVSRQFELLDLTKRVVDKAVALKVEPIRDTWLDQADYGIIGLIVHDGEWPSVRPEDVWGPRAAVDIVLDLVKDDIDLLFELSRRSQEAIIAHGIADTIEGAEVVEI